jgi:hypothetical protein
MTGVIITETNMTEYGTVEKIIGQLCMGPYLNGNYNSLSTLYCMRLLTEVLNPVSDSYFQ